MNRIKFLLGSVLIFLMVFSSISPVGATMIKEVAIGVFGNAANLAEAERYYMRYHGPEVARRAGPWMTRYQLWLPYEPPEEAVERFGAVRGRYAELWFRSEDLADYRQIPDAGKMPPMTPPPFNYEGNPLPSTQQNIHIAIAPSEVFYDSKPFPEETPVLRWITFIRYPDGVSVEDGDKWFVDVHAKEALKQPGLLKFVSHTAYPVQAYRSPDMPEPESWVRLCEYWYKDFESWRKAVLESPPKYTPPPWGGEYPFVEMASTFIPYYPDVDFLKGTYTVNFDMPTGLPTSQRLEKPTGNYDAFSFEGANRLLP